MFRRFIYHVSILYKSFVDNVSRGCSYIRKIFWDDGGRQWVSSLRSGRGRKWKMASLQASVTTALSRIHVAPILPKITAFCAGLSFTSSITSICSQKTLKTGRTRWQATWVLQRANPGSRSRWATVLQLIVTEEHMELQGIIGMIVIEVWISFFKLFVFEIT